MLNVLLSVALLAQADSPPTSRVEAPDSRTVKVELEAGRQAGQTATETRTRRRHAPRQAEQQTRILDVELRADPITGRRCAYVFSVPGDPESREAIANELRSLDYVGRYGVCSNSPERPAANRTPSLPAIAAQAWRDQVTLPDPQPRIAPGWAITGKPSYLEDLAPTTQHGTFEAFGYDVEVVATTTAIDVDWGDGSPTERNITKQPRPWPDGEITHVYQHVQPVTVTVIRHWSARWRIGNATGTLTEPLATTATIPLEVRDVIAVRNH